MFAATPPQPRPLDHSLDAYLLAVNGEASTSLQHTLDDMAALREAAWTRATEAEAQYAYLRRDDDAEVLDPRTLRHALLAFGLGVALFFLLVIFPQTPGVLP